MTWLMYRENRRIMMFTSNLLYLRRVSMPSYICSILCMLYMFGHEWGEDSLEIKVLKSKTNLTFLGILFNQTHILAHIQLKDVS